MNRAHFFPKHKAEGIHPLPNCGVISLKTPGDADADLHADWAAVLRLAFHDIDKPHPEFVACDEAMAAEIVAFLRANEHLDEVLVHCDLGISRSAAVALFIGDAFEVPVFMQGSPVDRRYQAYNKRVYRLLSDAYWRDA